MCAGVGIMRVRAHGARSGVGRKRKERPRGKKSATAQRLAGVARRRYLRSGSAPCAAVVRICGQIRQSLARQAPLGLAGKVSDLVFAPRASLVGRRVMRRMNLCLRGVGRSSACTDRLMRAWIDIHHSGQQRHAAGAACQRRVVSNSGLVSAGRRGSMVFAFLCFVRGNPRSSASCSRRHGDAAPRPTA